jgi:hypothetical protein
MRKQIIVTTLIALTLTMTLSIPAVFAGFNNQNGDNGYQGTNKPSNTLPVQSNVPPPAGLLEDLFGAPRVVDGCRAGGGNITIWEEGLGQVDGGPCCKGPFLYLDEDDPVYAPNQCCNPPDIIFLGNPDFYTPGNHCLCFVMRMPWPPQLP